MVVRAEPPTTRVGPPRGPAFTQLWQTRKGKLLGATRRRLCVSEDGGASFRALVVADEAAEITVEQTERRGGWLVVATAEQSARERERGASRRVVGAWTSSDEEARSFEPLSLPAVAERAVIEVFTDRLGTLFAATERALYRRAIDEARWEGTARVARTRGSHDRRLRSRAHRAEHGGRRRRLCVSELRSRSTMAAVSPRGVGHRRRSRDRALLGSARRDRSGPGADSVALELRRRAHVERGRVRRSGAAPRARARRRGERARAMQDGARGHDRVPRSRADAAARRSSRGRDLRSWPVRTRDGVGHPRHVRLWTLVRAARVP
jgi:hypothetical protein